MNVTNQLKRKFLKSFNIPYGITEEPYFSSAIRTLGYETQYRVFEKFVRDFDNIEEIYKYSDTIVGNKSTDGVVISHIKQLQNYGIAFKNDLFISQYKSEMDNVNRMSKLNSSDNVDCYYISIDMKEANYQVFKYLGLIDDVDYSEFISKFTDYEYFKIAKHTRQVIFGKLNPKRQQIYQRHIMVKLYDDLKSIFDVDIYYHTSDELIIKLSVSKNTFEINHGLYHVEYESLLEAIKIHINNEYQTNFKVSLFYLDVLKTTSGNYYFKRTNQLNKPFGVSKQEYIEVFKIINQIPITTTDLYSIIKTGTTNRYATLEPLVCL